MNIATATLEMQAAVLARVQSLVTSGTVQGIWDWVPEDQDPGTTFPYITIGDVVGRRWRALNDDGWKGTFTLHVFSEFRGFEEATEIMGALVDAVESEPMTIDGVDVTLVNYVNHYTIRDADGLTRHIPVVFDVWMRWSVA